MMIDSLEASELALCPACADGDLTLCNQTFRLLRLLVSNGSCGGTAKPGLPLLTLYILSVLRPFCRERSQGLFLGFTLRCGMT